MQKHNNSQPFERKSHFNSNRTCYLSSDGKYYCFEVWDSAANRTVTQRLEVGKDLSLEWTIFLDETDHQMDLSDRYEAEVRDPRFEAKVASYEQSSGYEDAVDPWSTIADAGHGPEDVLFAEPVRENPNIEKVRYVIENDCTEAQQNFYYEHFGSRTQLEEMRQEEAKRTGKLPSPQAMTNRKNKIVDKVAKSLGTERVKRRKQSKKG